MSDDGIRRAEFKVALGEPIEGQKEATLTVEIDAHGRGSISVRPKGRHTLLRVSLGTACQLIAWRAAKESAAAAGVPIPKPRGRNTGLL